MIIASRPRTQSNPNLNGIKRIDTGGKPPKRQGLTRRNNEKRVMKDEEKTEREKKPGVGEIDSWPDQMSG